jgi:hypothetical protein
MRISVCFSYDEVTVRLSRIEESLAVELKTDKGVNLTLTLQPMQGKILGEAILRAAGNMPVGQIKGEFAGSMQVEYDLANEQEELPCQLQDLFVPADKKSLFKSA